MLKSNINRIKQLLSTEEILAQLEEECAELIQAASKLRRAINGDNPTPVTVDEATNMITEEFADVLLCLDILGFKPDDRQIAKIQHRKALRWVSRLNETEGDMT